MFWMLGSQTKYSKKQWKEITVNRQLCLQEAIMTISYHSFHMSLIPRWLKFEVITCTLLSKQLTTWTNIQTIASLRHMVEICKTRSRLEANFNNKKRSNSISSLWKMNFILTYWLMWDQEPHSREWILQRALRVFAEHL